MSSAKRAEASVNMENKEQLPSRAPRRRVSKLWIIILSVVAAVIIIALAVGLGVGLTRNKMGAGSSSPSSSSSPASTPSIVAGIGNNAYWQPAANTSWQIVLRTPLALDLSSNTVTPDVDAWDIDLFTNTNDTIKHLHDLGKHVICYFSAGSYEPNRPDSNQFDQSQLGLELDGWPGEYWLNVSSSNVRTIMANRIALAASKQCDAIDPDNVDGYNNKNGLGLVKQDSIAFVKFLSETAKAYNISTGLKNAAAIIPDVMDHTAFNVNEQCVQFSECTKFNSYITANKPVFHIEYPKGDNTNQTNEYATVDTQLVNDICSTSGNATGSYDFSTVIKNMNLDGWAQLCNDQTYITPCSGSSDKAKGYGSAPPLTAVAYGGSDDGSDDS